MSDNTTMAKMDTIPVVSLYDLTRTIFTFVSIHTLTHSNKKAKKLCHSYNSLAGFTHKTQP